MPATPSPLRGATGSAPRPPITSTASPSPRSSAFVAATALGHNRLNAIARHTVLCDPSDPERNPANPRRSGWQTDPVSGPLYQHLREIAATVRPYLEGFEDAPTLAESSDAA
jgi:hypothetical protein